VSYAGALFAQYQADIRDLQQTVSQVRARAEVAEDGLNLTLQVV
jgi:hypothetical protein